MAQKRKAGRKEFSRMRKTARRWADQDLTISQRRLLYLGKALDEHCRMNRVEGDFRVIVMELGSVLSKQARQDAAETLRKEYGEDKRSLKPLLWAALNEPDMETRENAYYQLALHPHKKLAVNEAREVARKHPNDRVRSFATAVLGVCRDRQSIPFIEKGLQSETQVLRWESAMALAAMGERKHKAEVYETVEEIFKHGSGGMRSWAARSLRGLNEERSVDLLIKALKDKEADVVREAVKSLGALKAEKAYPSLLKMIGHKETVVYGSALDALLSFEGRQKELKSFFTERVSQASAGKKKDALARTLGRLLGEMAKKRATGSRAKKINAAEKFFAGFLKDWQQGYLFFEIFSNAQLARSLPLNLTEKGQREKVEFLQNLRHQADREPVELAEIFGHVKPGKKSLRSRLWQLLKRKGKK